MYCVRLWILNCTSEEVDAPGPPNAPKTGPQTGIVGDPCASAPVPMRRTACTLVAGYFPPFACASVVRSGTGPFSAPAAGPPPWDVYEFTPETVYALATAEPGGATRFRF